MRRLSAVLCALLAVGPAFADSEAEEPAWQTVKTRYMAGKGSTLPFELPLASADKAIESIVSLPVKGGIKLASDKSNVGIDTGSDGRVDHWVRGKSARVTLVLTAEDGKRSPYQVLATKNEATKKYTYRADCYRMAAIKGAKIVLIDGDGDGRYDGSGDTIVVGRKPTLGMPLGSVIAVNGKLKEIKVRADGAEIQLRDYTGSTGTLDLLSGFKRNASGKLTSAIVTGPSGSFDVLANKGKEAVLPAGRYSFRWGKISAGARNAQITWTKTFTVGGEGSGPIEWGAPFKLVTPVTRSGINLTVNPDAIKILGRGGESYGKFLPTAVSVRMLVRDKETKKQLLKRSGGGISAC